MHHHFSLPNNIKKKKKAIVKYSHEPASSLCSLISRLASAPLKYRSLTAVQISLLVRKSSDALEKLACWNIIHWGWVVKYSRNNHIITFISCIFHSLLLSSHAFINQILHKISPPHSRVWKVIAQQLGNVKFSLSGV